MVMSGSVLNNTTDYMNGFGHSLDSSFAVPLATYFLFVVAFAVLFNTALIITILSEKKLYTTTNIYIINLAVGDLLTAVVTIPFDVDFLIRDYYPYGKIPCGFKEVVFMLSLPSSVINLLLLTIERFVCIKYPYKEQHYFTKTTITLSIIGVWFYSIIIAIFPTLLTDEAVSTDNGRCVLSFPKEFSLLYLLANFIVPLIVILTLNFLLFILARDHQKRIRSVTVYSDKTLNQKQGSLFHHFKLAKTVFLLVGNFFICWLTYIILVTVNVSCWGCLSREALWLGNAVNFTNVVINPLLYGLLNKSIRGPLVKKLTKIFSLCCVTEKNQVRKQDNTTSSPFLRRSLVASYHGSHTTLDYTGTNETTIMQSC